MKTKAAESLPAAPALPSSPAPSRRSPHSPCAEEDFDRLLGMASARLASLADSRTSPFSSLASDLVHEIRNPLAGISGVLEILHGSPSLVHSHGRMLSLAQQEIRRIERNLQGFLDFVSPKPLRSSLAPLQPAVHAAADAASSLARARSIQIQLSLPTSAPLILHDSFAIQRLLLALLTNSIEALSPGGRIHLQFAIQQPFASVSIYDDGPGIPASLRPLIFHPFFCSKTNASGLGLALARQTAQAHGGALDLIDSSSQGAHFLLSLPLPLQPPDFLPPSQ